jgi:fatty acid desaturase
VAETPDLLVSDADRTRVSGQLREHYEAGRLTLDEFQERLDEAHAARTEGQLRNALRQLPAAKLPTVRLRDTRWQSLALQYALVNVIAICVWLFGGAQGDFWPKWVLLVTLIMFTRRTVGRSRGRSLPRPPRPPDA